MRSRLAVLLACVGVLLVTAWFVGSRFDPPPRPAGGTVALGPEAGEAVDEYLARVQAELPPPGVAVHALVQLRAELTVADAAALLDTPTGPAAKAPGAGGTPAGPVAPAAAGAASGRPPGNTGPVVASAVLHVPLPRVQTALRFAALDPGAPLVTGLEAAREGARFAASADTARRTGRAADVAAAEAAALADRGCRCVLALVVRADRAGLDALATRAEVRVVHAAPAGAVPVELALSPLLPGQTERAEPLPDDGSP